MVRLTRTCNTADNILFSFNLDNTSIYIPIPHECITETNTCDANIGSLSEINDFDVRRPNWMPAKRVLSTNLPYWEVSSELPLNPASIMIQIFKVGDFRLTPSNNIFNDIEYCELLFTMKENLRKILIDAQCKKEFFVFPDSIDQINIIDHGKLKWAQTKAGYAEAAPADITFVTPLSNDLLLVIDTNTKKFDYGTEKENAAMRAEAESDLFEFIKSIRIDFSPEIQAQIDEARATENA